MLDRVINAVIHPRKALRGHRLRQAGIAPHEFYNYSLPWLVARKFDLVLDIGAARGTHTLLFRRLFPDAHIVAFEPIPKSFVELTRRTSGQRNIKCYQCALSDRDGTATFHLGGNRYLDASSLLPIGQGHEELWPSSRSGRSIEVQTCRLDSLIQLKGNERVFVKMDVQGGEMMAINGGLNVFSVVDTVVVEASMRPLYKGAGLFHELYERMYSSSFEYAGVLDQCFSPSGSGEVIQGDIIFRRKRASP